MNNCGSSEITELVTLTRAFSQSESLILIICYFAIWKASTYPNLLMLKLAISWDRSYCTAVARFSIYTLLLSKAIEMVKSRFQTQGGALGKVRIIFHQKCNLCCRAVGVQAVNNQWHVIYEFRTSYALLSLSISITNLWMPLLSSNMYLARQKTTGNGRRAVILEQRFPKTQNRCCKKCYLGGISC